MTKQRNDAPAVVPPLGHADERQVFYSNSASTVVRALVLSGIGVVWLFSHRPGATAAPQTGLDEIRASGLFGPLICYVIALLFDLLQYVTGATAWATYHWTLDQLLRDEDATKPLGKRCAVAWRLAGPLRLRALVESVGETRPADFAARTQAARTVLAAARKGEANSSDRLTAFLGSKDSPTWINATTRTLFVLKIGAATAAYCWLAAYLF